LERVLAPPDVGRAANPAGTWEVSVLIVPDRSPCPYCENYEGRHGWHGPPATIFEDDIMVIFLAPAALGGMPGHTLVTTRRHVETICDLTPGEEAALGHGVARAARMLRAALDPDGLLIQQNNGVAAFQTVPHVHFHVIPKRADTPFPPHEQVPVIPAAERMRLARRLRQHWTSSGPPGDDPDPDT
jgi:histidine triad (HIT) family protein